MTFRRGGAGKRRDGNEKAVIEALEAVGATIWQINGRMLPDILVLHKGTWTPLGIKTEKGSLQPGEEHARWPLVRSEEEALSAIGATVNSGARAQAGSR